MGCGESKINNCPTNEWLMDRLKVGRCTLREPEIVTVERTGGTPCMRCERMHPDIRVPSDARVPRAVHYVSVMVTPVALINRMEELEAEGLSEDEAEAQAKREHGGTLQAEAALCADCMGKALADELLSLGRIRDDDGDDPDDAGNDLVPQGMIYAPGGTVVSRFEVPDGHRLVHNQVYPDGRRPALRQGWQGSRFWAQRPGTGSALEPCGCGWAPEHGTHYRPA